MCCRFRDMRSCQCTVLTIAILHEYTSGQGKHGCPQFCPLSKVASATCCGLLACRPHCVRTQLWPSQGSSRNLPSWLRFQVRLSAASGNLCQVYCVTCQASKSVCVFFCSSRAVSTWEIYTSCDVGGKKSRCDTSLKLCHNHTRRFTQYRAEYNSDSDCTPRVTQCVCFMTSCLGNYGLVLSCSVWMQNLVKCVFVYHQLLYPSLFLLMSFPGLSLRHTYFASIWICHCVNNMFWISNNQK